ncbi:SDR family oxidoreductase [Luteibacter yeojuensis]|uniref:DltE n=1 Tax=Luteibacter yeojuensis TaxID=345309 RepID=A0A0F3KMF5_9GAMM|nr:SDR family NAD(P)-dependent oxidoreductase [Luteibacter yeojuensis]KJV31294.1 DltE [Luteibacter yeojuensis]
MNISGNTILVTGGTSGIGRALAESLNDAGNCVIVSGRRQSLLDEVTAGREHMHGVLVDVTDPGSVTALAQKVRTDFAGLNVLIANAGISRPENLLDEAWTPDDAEAMVSTNILGVIRVTGALLPVMANQSEATLIATSSDLAFIPMAAFPTYCATKAFLHSWLQSARHQLRRAGVEVIELSPPYVQTELTGARQASDPRAMPLGSYVAYVMDCLAEKNLPRGELLLNDASGRRFAERNGVYEAMFAAMNSR